MSAATGTDDLSPHAVSIRHPLHRARNLIIKTRPPTTRVELIIRTIQRRVATFAEIRALLPEIVIFAREGRLRRLMNDNPLFLTAQIVVARRRIFTLLAHRINCSTIFLLAQAAGVIRTKTVIPRLKCGAWDFDAGLLVTGKAATEDAAIGGVEWWLDHEFAVGYDGLVVYGYCGFV